MADQELIDWIKKKIETGYPSSQIYDSLIKEGYTSTEASEAIAIATKPKFEPIPVSKSTSEKRPINVLLIIIVGFIVIAAVVAGLIFLNKPTTEANNLQGDSNSQNLNNVNQNSTTGCSLKTLDCFLENLENCTPMNYQYDVNMPNPFMPLLLIETGQLYSIKSSNENGCNVQIVQNKYQISKNPEMTEEKYRQHLIDLNQYDSETYSYPDDAQIAAMLEQANSTSAMVIGLTSTCDFNSSQIEMLISDFRNFENGEISASTEKNNFLYSGCTGNLFTTNN